MKTLLRNEKGIIALAIILSTLLIIGALAVFGVVSGRFGITYRLNDRVQAIRNTEAASYVAYQFMREGLWYTPAEEFADIDGNGAPGVHNITITDSDGNDIDVTITVSNSGDNKVSAKVDY